MSEPHTDHPGAEVVPLRAPEVVPTDTAATVDSVKVDRQRTRR